MLMAPVRCPRRLEFFGLQTEIRILMWSRRRLPAHRATINAVARARVLDGDIRVQISTRIARQDGGSSNP